MFIHSLTHNGEGAEYLLGYVAGFALVFVLVALVASIVRYMIEENQWADVGRAFVKLWRWLF